MGFLTTDSDVEGDSAPRLSSGTVIAGRYRIAERIGQGGMAEVYKAFQPALSRFVAIKMMRSGSPRDSRRFTIEAQTLARLRHPNAVAAHDYGIYEDDAGNGRPFIVMELVEGETLRDRIRREGSLAPDVVRHIAREVASCVKAAHDGGIIHRDLKPTNIMLVKDSDPERPEVRVLDFGIAKLFAPRVSLTDEGELVGSPRYMAPEQFDEDVSIDPRVDVWTLGILIYEMASGDHPIRHKAKFSEVLSWLREGPPEPPPALPPDLAHTFSQCLQRDPDERAQSMTEVLELLGARPGRPRWVGPVVVGAVAVAAAGVALAIALSG